MTSADWYRGRTAHWTAVRARQALAATRFSRLRLLAFGGFAFLTGWGWHISASPIVLVGIASLLAFAVLVRQHAQVLDRIERADAALRLSAIGVARLSRDWNALPDVLPPPELDLDTHPYARDLDLFGHASLTKWLGRTATKDGSRTLWNWLLEPGSGEAVVERQTAVAELAALRPWRERLAIEGELTVISAAELTRFLAWAEDNHSAVPALMKGVAIALPVTLAALLALMIAGVIAGAWWLIPLFVNVVLSFALAGRIFATFDCVTVGQRSLIRYGAMLDLVCGNPWQSPLLQRLREQMCAGGPAPAAVRRIAALAGWSELRSGAALLHVPIEALTLWDFHVLFAMERWRARAGRHVRSWLDALGTADALATLAIVRADEPDWAVPRVEAEADSMIATAIAHPLIAPARRVSNDIRIGPAGTILLITGSNMSGKSTLLRAAGLNAVLAHAGAPVCATTLLMPPVELQTSIRVQDSLELGLSYFMAALARLKQIVDAAAREHAAASPEAPRRRLLYLLDEVLQGTNSVERGVAVCAVARHLLEAGAIGAMTTHDLALAGDEPLKSSATLVHFTEQVGPDGAMTFDYRLRPGIATSTNALRLMQAIGITPR